MAEIEEHRGGERIKSEELFDYIFALASSTYGHLQDSEVVRDEMRRVLTNLVAAYTQTQSNLLAIAKDVERKYAPQAVEQTIAQANSHIGRLESAIASAENSMKRATSQAISAVWSRTLVGGVVGLMFLGAQVGLFLWWYPSAQVMAEARTELAELREQRGVIEAILKADGKNWIPITANGLVCDPPGSKHCQVYGEVK